MPAKPFASLGWIWPLKKMSLFCCNQLINVLRSSINDGFLKYIIQNKVSPGLRY
jgi:hypothetical protein